MPPVRRSVEGASLVVPWDIKLSEYCSAWRKGLRRIWELPSIYMFRSDYLPVVAGTSPICDELCRRFLNFIAILVILNLFVLLLSMLSYYVREYLSVVITWCVTRDMASRWRVNLGLVSNLRAAVLRCQCSCLLLTAVILLSLWNWLRWEQVFCTFLSANGVERKSTVCWLLLAHVSVCNFSFSFTHTFFI